MNRFSAVSAIAALVCVAKPLHIEDATAQGAVTLEAAKLIIEHNATDNDTGFQGFVDSDGWQRLVVFGPDGAPFAFEALGKLGKLGVTELFFETVEPLEDDMPIDEVLSALPEGNYTIEGPAMQAGESQGMTRGVALLTHAVPAAPELLAPAEDVVVPTGRLAMRWKPVSQAIDGAPINIIAYQLIIERDEDPNANMIGKFGLSMYVPPSTTTVEIAEGFLEPSTSYVWEVLAIEESGNQTLSSSAFRTE